MFKVQVSAIGFIKGRFKHFTNTEITAVEPHVN